MSPINKKPPTTELPIVGREVAAPLEGVASEYWSSTHYEVGTSRSDASALPVALPSGSVIEFELIGGEKILVAAAEVDDYLGASTRDTNPSKPLTLEPNGRSYASASRGLGDWVVKGLRVLTRTQAKPAADELARVLQTKTLGTSPGFYRVGANPAELTACELATAPVAPMLVLIHGTISSANDNFGDLWTGALRSTLRDKFEDRIYALQHNTLTESPVANALALARALPVGARVHLLTHSRGGLVGELLCRGRTGADAFAADEITALETAAKSLERNGYDVIANMLRDLNTELARKQLRIERFVRVACPARGTTLLSQRLDRWTSAMVNLFSKLAKLTATPVGVGAGVALESFYNFAADVLAERRDATALPGLEAMLPDSPLIALLNRDQRELESALHVIAGDYVSDGVLTYLGDAFAERFYGGMTDLVVNTASMAGGAPRRDGIYYQLFNSAEGHHHLNYFSLRDSAQATIDALTQADASQVAGFEKLAGPSRTQIARGGTSPMPRTDAPILFVLPGTMGSALQRNGNTIWFELFDIACGKFSELTFGNDGISSAGWLDQYYEDLCTHFAKSHEIRPFAYDWRLSVATEAARLGTELDKALVDAKTRNKPVHIIAHSMGGLVARVALAKRWTRFKAIPGSRLLQLGTPNGGSVASAGVLLARDSLIRKIIALDLKHDAQEFLTMVSQFPGVLELLAWNNVPTVATNFFDFAAYQMWHNTDEVNEATSWVVPTQKALNDAQQVAQQIANAPLDPAACAYVAGVDDETPIDVVLDQQEVRLRYTNEGDGRVPWATGIPPGVAHWYVEAAHGDLPSAAEAFDGYHEILDNGDTTLLSKAPPARRDISTTRGAKAQETLSLYPSRDEVVAAAMGAKRRAIKTPAKIRGTMVEIVIVQGSLVTADDPIMLGAYAYDAIRGSNALIDRRLGGRLTRAKNRGTFPNNVGEAQVYLQPKPEARPKGAIVVGLGPVAGTAPRDLARAYERGLLAFEETQRNQPMQGDSAPTTFDVATLLIGTGFGGLSVDTSVRSLLDAVVAVAAKLNDQTSPLSLRRVTIYERTENRAVTAAIVLSNLLKSSRYRNVVRSDGRVHPGKGGFRPLLLDMSGSEGVRRAHITTDDAGKNLYFTLITDRARNLVEVEPNQRQTIDSMLQRATGDTNDQPGLSRAIFELLVPNAFKEGIADTGGLILGLDYRTAEYPWEFLREVAADSERPLCTRIPVIRQLATERGRPMGEMAQGNVVFVIGDTDSGYAELVGAQEESQSVAQIAQSAQWQVKLLIRPKADDVLQGLFDRDYRVLHLACHGIAEPPLTPEEEASPTKREPRVGAVLAKDVLLTSAQVAKMRRVPELVFLNCCHLGNMEMESANKWNRLAANLSTQFIEMGAKAVIAAGWAVHDGAASIFADNFYRAMFSGQRFGEAVRLAREKTYDEFSFTNTWGAYQAYGDENYRLTEAGNDLSDAVHPTMIYRPVLLARLEELRGEAEVASDEDERNAITAELAALAKTLSSAFAKDARIGEALGYAYAELQYWQEAIENFRAAVQAEEATVEVRVIERLADAETRYGADLALSNDQVARKQGQELLDKARTRLEKLNALNGSSERYSLLGANYKRRAELADHTSREFMSSLRAMTDNYGKAVAIARENAGTASFYANFNQLCGKIILRAHGKLPTSEVRKISNTLDACIKQILNDAVNQRAERHEFFNVIASADAALVQLLWRSVGKKNSRSSTEKSRSRRTSTSHPASADETSLAALANQYVAAIQRFGSARETDSTCGHIDSLAAMLPAKSAPRIMLEKLEALIRKSCGGIKD